MSNDRRQKILDVSRKLFLYHGYQKVTLVDIAEALGISRPTLYQAFSNKEEIFTTLLEDWWRTAVDRIMENRNPGAGVRKQLRDAIEIWTIEPYQMVNESPRGEKLADCSYDFAKSTMDAGYVEFAKQLNTILKDGKVQGALPNKDLADFIAVSVRGLKVQAKDLDDLRRLINNLLKLILACPT